MSDPVTKDEALIVVARCAWRCRAAQRKLPPSALRSDLAKAAWVEETNLDRALAALAQVMPGPT